jgi:2-phospho-L-lactate guanylyltransferase
MKLWAIVPVKPLRRGKSRLSGVLSEDERTALNSTMLTNTLKVLSGVDEINQILVVSRDPGALALARDYKVKTVQEDGNPGLNTALRRAEAVAKAYAADSILIIPADLPLLRPNDVQDFLHRVTGKPQLIIAPDRRQEGTNALFMTPISLIPFNFGVGSFNRHIQSAQRKNISPDIVETTAFGLDLDLPTDLDLLKELEVSEISKDKSS